MAAVVKACTVAVQVPGVSQGLWISNVGQGGHNYRRSEQERHGTPRCTLLPGDPFQIPPILIAELLAQVTKLMQRERERGQLECSKHGALMVHYVLYLCLTDKGALRIYIKRWNGEGTVRS